MFQATHAARYQRQDLIRKIEAKFGKRLVSYVASSAALINRDDTVFFVDLLHNVEHDTALDLTLSHRRRRYRRGGKLISILRTRVGTGYISVQIRGITQAL